MLLKEIKECRINQLILNEQENLIKTLKEQNELLKTQNQKLLEVIDLQKKEIEALKILQSNTEKELKKAEKQRMTFFQKLQFATFFTFLGLIIGASL